MTYNNGLQSQRVYSYILLNFANLVVIVVLPLPAMKVQKLSKNILAVLTKIVPPKRNRNTKYQLYNLSFFTHTHEKIIMFDNFLIDYKLLFSVITTNFSYLIVSLQFELESSKVDEFSLF